MEMKIERAVIKDAEVFYQMYDQLRDHVEKGCDKPSLEEYELLFKTLLYDPAYSFWKIIGDNESIVGVMTVNVRENLFHCKKIVYVDEIVVAESYRDRGYGRKGLEYLINFYKKQGDVVKVELSTDYNNTPARGFYDHIGFLDYAALYKVKTK